MRLDRLRTGENFYWGNECHHRRKRLCIVYNGLGAAHSEPALVGILGLLQAPMADNFAARGSFNGISITASGNNVGATSEVGEPLHAGKPGGKSMWVTWVPTLSGVATVTT